MNTSATGAFVMNRLSPLMTQPPPEAVATEVTRPAGSEPASSSVSANAAVHSPAASLGRSSFFCSSVPPSSTTCPAMRLLVPNIGRTAGFVSPSPRTSRTSCDIVRPRPPYSSGIAKPNSPICAASSRSPAGTSSVSSICASCGITRSRMSDRTVAMTTSRSALSITRLLTASALTAGQLTPRLAAPGVGLPGQPEHPLGEHVAVDLARATLDRVRSAAQHAAYLGWHAASVVRRVGGVAWPGHPGGPEQVSGRFLDPLVQLGGVHLADRALRSRRPPGGEPGAHPLVRPRAGPLLAVQPHQPVPGPRVIPAAGQAVGRHLAGQPDQRPGAGAADPVHAAGARSRHHLPLAAQRRLGNLPALALRADPLGVRNPGGVEERLEELDL